MSGAVLPSAVLASAQQLGRQKGVLWTEIHLLSFGSHMCTRSSQSLGSQFPDKGYAIKILIINVLKIRPDLPNILLAVAMEMFSNKTYSGLPSQCSRLQSNRPLSKHSFMSLMSIRQTWPPSLLQNAELLAKMLFITTPIPCPD